MSYEQNVKLLSDRVRDEHDHYPTPAGLVRAALRLAFLEGQRRTAGLWKSHRPHTVAVCGKRPSFTGNGKTDATAYAVFIWHKRAGIQDTVLTWLHWDDSELVSKPTPTTVPMFASLPDAA